MPTITQEIHPKAQEQPIEAIKETTLYPAELPCDKRAKPTFVVEEDKSESESEPEPHHEARHLKSGTYYYPPSDKGKQKKIYKGKYKGKSTGEPPRPPRPSRGETIYFDDYQEDSVWTPPVTNAPRRLSISPTSSRPYENMRLIYKVRQVPDGPGRWKQVLEPEWLPKDQFQGQINIGPEHETAHVPPFAYIQQPQQWSTSTESQEGILLAPEYRPPLIVPQPVTTTTAVPATWESQLRVAQTHPHLTYNRVRYPTSYPVRERRVPDRLGQKIHYL